MMSGDIHPDVARVLFTESEIQTRLREMGAEITDFYREKNPVVVCVLKGAVYVLSDLTRCIETDIEIDFMVVASYGADTKSSGVVRIVKDLGMSIQDRHVLVIEDIIDTGLTLKYLLRNFAARGAASIEVAALLWKKDAQEIKINARWVGFKIPNEFVIGYGLDYAEKYRNLPYVGVIKSEAVG
jgi:hypoxanthine phosphoribosyltransferase